MVRSGGTGICKEEIKVVFGSATQYWGSKGRKRNHVIVQHRKVDWPIKLVPLLRDYMFSLAVYGNFCFKKRDIT
jgi:hypothetical protein